MDNRGMKKWQYVLFLIVAVLMFVVSVVALSAKNNVAGFFENADSYMSLFDSGLFGSDRTDKEADTDFESEDCAPTYQSEIDETVITEEQSVETLPPENEAAETQPVTDEENGPFVPPTVTEIDDEFEETEPPFVRTEPAIPGKVHEYAVGESARVDDSFFSDALFIGDSRTQGIQYDGNIQNATFYAYRGLNVITAMKSPFVEEYGEEMLLVDALSLHPEFKKIYICFGLNDFWFTESAYRQKYSELIDAVKSAASPDAVIYMYAVVPVLDGMQKGEEGLNNAKMIRFNQIAAEIAMSKGVKFVDVSEAFIKEDGFRYLTEDESPDGIHLNKPLITRICEYLRTHT